MKHAIPIDNTSMMMTTLFQILQQTGKNLQEIGLETPITLPHELKTQANKESLPPRFYEKIKEAFTFPKKEKLLPKDDPEKTLGIEILSFDDVELYHCSNDREHFDSMGTLKVVYFRDFQSFVLYLNDWSYLLLKELPILKSTTHPSGSLLYYLTSKDMILCLKFLQNTQKESLQNFDTIVENNSNFLTNDEAER